VKWRNFGFSLNPQNSHFSMKEGNILVQIVSKGVRIDSEKGGGDQTNLLS
jgi:hypothetical protein